MTLCTTASSVVMLFLRDTVITFSSVKHFAFISHTHPQNVCWVHKFTTICFTHIQCCTMSSYSLRLENETQQIEFVCTGSFGMDGYGRLKQPFQERGVYGVEVYMEFMHKSPESVRWRYSEETRIVRVTVLENNWWGPAIINVRTRPERFCVCIYRHVIRVFVRSADAPHHHNHQHRRILEEKTRASRARFSIFIYANLWDPRCRTGCILTTVTGNAST